MNPLASLARPLTVHRCSWAGDDEACEIRDATGKRRVYDASYDECHHVMSRAWADALVSVINELPEPT